MIPDPHSVRTTLIVAYLVGPEQVVHDATCDGPALLQLVRPSRLPRGAVLLGHDGQQVVPEYHTVVADTRIRRRLVDQVPVSKRA